MRMVRSRGSARKGLAIQHCKGGMASCGKIAITVTGTNKTKALREALEGPFDPIKKPVQTLREIADKTVWLVDASAGTELAGL